MQRSRCARRTLDTQLVVVAINTFNTHRLFNTICTVPRGVDELFESDTSLHTRFFNNAHIIRACWTLAVPSKCRCTFSF